MSEEMSSGAETVDVSPAAETQTTETSTSTQTQGNAPETVSDVPALGVDGAAVPPAYTPNFKVKIFDIEAQKHVEKEMDEWARGYIKDAETEKKFKELYEKAFGIETTKVSRDRYKGEASTLRNEIKDTKKALSTLSTYVQNDDMQSFFEALKIPEDKVLRYALNRIQYRDLPPEKRNEYDQMRTVSQRAQILEEQNQHLYEQFTNTQVQVRASELERTMSDPQVSQVAQSFDARVGMPGAFRDEVIKRGQMYWALHQKDVPADQVVREVLQIVGGMPATNESVATQGAAQVGGHTPERKPIIPNIQGRSTSPAKILPKSIKDLKRLAAEAS